MAVVQISRIQVRRGKKGTSNIPQLASGEIGWAVDSQELYIGNGSVSEGAPQVGNTKILTAADSIFEISSSYEYKSGVSYIQTGATAKVPTTSSLQTFLSVSGSRNLFLVPDGGNVGIGTTNPTAYKLTVNGTIGASGNITASYSDERLKTNLGPIIDLIGFI